MSVLDDTKRFLPKASLEAMIAALREQGYAVIAPIVRDSAIRLEEVERADQVARGVRDEQTPGHYRVLPGDDAMHFDYAASPDSAKKFFFPPRQELFSLHIEGERFAFDRTEPSAPKLAILGLRACDLAAIAVQDRVFGYEQPTGDEAPWDSGFRCESEMYYSQTREQSMLIAVNCTRPAATCFCTSWNTGPRVNQDMVFDVALTELRHGFVVEVGSKKGQHFIDALELQPVGDAERELANLMLERAAERIDRGLNTEDIVALMDRTINSPRYDAVAKRCLSCTNCTMACPTCFCSTVEDSNDLATGQSTRTRQWESCFTHQFSYTTPGPVRGSIRSRYRQWLRHKLATWWDQFDCSGCVGCGRCITWCPVGIDLTEEVDAIRRYDTQNTNAAPPHIAVEIES